MLLIRCYISNFGKLHDFSFDFSEDWNVVLRENGWGKSTFAAFLRAMLYGLPSGGSRTKLNDAPRKKYLPWQGGAYGGYLVFEAKGKQYKVERSFGNKESEDTFRLTDAVTHLESKEYSTELGYELFGLDREAFARTTYFPQNQMENSRLNDSIRARLGRLSDGDEDKSRFEEACDALDALRKKYLPDRKKDEKGKLAELTRQKTEVERWLSECEEKRREAEEWRRREAELAKEKEVAELQRKELQDRQEQLENKQRLTEKRKYYEELCREEQKREARFRNSCGSIERIQEETVVRLAKEDQELIIRREQLLQAGEVLGTKQKQVEQKRKRYRFIAAVCFVLMLVSAGAAVVRGLSAKPKGAAALGCAVLGTYFALSSGKQKRGERVLSEKQTETREQLAVCELEVQRVFEQYGSLGIYGAQPMERRFMLENRFREQQMFWEEYEAAKEKRVRFEAENSTVCLSIAEQEAETPEELQATAESVTEKLSELERQLFVTRERALQLETEAEKETEARERLYALQEELEKSRKEHAIVVETLRCLKDAKQSFSGRYQKKLEQSFQEYVSLFSEGAEEELQRDREAVLDSELSLRISAYGQERELDYFSKGMQDLVYFCMRLALVDTLFSEEPPFLLLDDPFVNLDEVNLSRALELIKASAGKYQIVYLVCHESRM